MTKVGANGIYCGPWFIKRFEAPSAGPMPAMLWRISISNLVSIFHLLAVKPEIFRRSGAPLIFIPLFIAIKVWALKMIVEPGLTRCLGEAYIVYTAQAPMFFPF